jgi:ABC-2 type transport system permease protein
MKVGSETALAATAHLVRQRRPSRVEAGLVGSGALFLASLRRYLRSRRAAVMAAVLMLPAGLVILTNVLRPVEVADGWFTGREAALVFTMFATAFVPFTALLFSGGAIQDEIEEQTLTYLFVRPIPRWAIFLAKAAAIWLTVTALVLGVTAFAILANYWPSNLFNEQFARLPKALGIFAALVFAYTGVFMLLGLITKRSLLFGIIYIVLFEWILGAIPFNFRAYTIIYYFRLLCVRNLDADPSGWALVRLETLASTKECLLALGGAGATALLFGCLLMTMREFRVKTPEGA